MARKKSPGAAAGAELRREPADAGGTASASPGSASAGAELAPRARGHRSLVTKRDLQAYRRRLEAELAELEGQRADLEESTGASLADATGEVGFDEEFADTGSFTFARERDLSLAGNARDLIDKVEHALAQIDAGGFGRCEACGAPIETERLDALPYTTLCLADARARVRPR
jgi:DnaK suppressor protein